MISYKESGWFARAQSFNVHVFMSGVAWEMDVIRLVTLWSYGWRSILIFFARSVPVQIYPLEAFVVLVQATRSSQGQGNEIETVKSGMYPQICKLYHIIWAYRCHCTKWHGDNEIRLGIHFTKFSRCTACAQLMLPHDWIRWLLLEVSSAVNQVLILFEIAQRPYCTAGHSLAWSQTMRGIWDSQPPPSSHPPFLPQSSATSYHLRAKQQHQ